MNDTYKRVAVVAAACCMSVWGTPVLVVVVLGSQVTRAGMKAATKQRAAAAAYTKRPVHGRLREKEKNKNRARARVYFTRPPDVRQAIPPPSPLAIYLNTINEVPIILRYYTI